MYNSLVSQMFEQYLSEGQINKDLWVKLGRIFKDNPPESLIVNIQVVSSVNIQITPWSIASAAQDFTLETLDVLLRSPKASENLFSITTDSKFTSRSFFDEMVSCANKVRNSVKRNQAFYALQHLYNENRIPVNAQVLIVSPDLLPKRLVNWALENNIGIVSYYNQYKKSDHNSPFWNDIEACAQKMLLTHELSSYGKSSTRLAKI